MNENVTETARVNEIVTETKNMMTVEELKKHLAENLNLKDFRCVSLFKSVGRALRRGHITPYGTIIPRRPFNNRKHTAGREMNESKKRIYAELVDKQRREVEGVQ